MLGHVSATMNAAKDKLKAVLRFKIQTRQLYTMDFHCGSTGQLMQKIYKMQLFDRVGGDATQFLAQNLQALGSKAWGRHNPFSGLRTGVLVSLPGTFRLNRYELQAFIP